MAEGAAASPVRHARTATRHANGGNRPGKAPARIGGGLAAPRGKRAVRVPEVVLGVLVVAGCALGAVLWQRSANTTTTVVVASRDIARGSVIGIDDLRGAQVGGETAAMISGGDAHLLLGKVAVVDIRAAVPLTETLFADAAQLSADEALTSAALAPGQLPPDLSAGDHVRIIVTSGAAPGGAATTTLLEPVVVVWAVDPAPDGANAVVTLRGPLAIGAEIAAAAEVRLLRVEGD